MSPVSKRSYLGTAPVSWLWRQHITPTWDLFVASIASRRPERYVIKLVAARFVRGKANYWLVYDTNAKQFLPMADYTACAETERDLLDLVVQKCPRLDPPKTTKPKRTNLGNPPQEGRGWRYVTQLRDENDQPWGVYLCEPEVRGAAAVMQAKAVAEEPVAGSANYVFTVGPTRITGGYSALYRVRPVLAVEIANTFKPYMHQDTTPAPAVTPLVHNAPTEEETRPTDWLPITLAECSTYAEQLAWCRKTLSERRVITYPALVAAGCAPERIIAQLRAYGLPLKSTNMRVVSKDGTARQVVAWRLNPAAM